MLTRLARGDLVRSLEFLLTSAPTVSPEKLAADLGVTLARAKRLIACFVAAGCVVSKRKQKTFLVDRRGIQQLLYGGDEDVARDTQDAPCKQQHGHSKRKPQKQWQSAKVPKLSVSGAAQEAAWSLGLESLAANRRERISKIDLCKMLGFSRHEGGVFCNRLVETGCAERLGNGSQLRLRLSAVLEQLGKCSAPFVAPVPSPDQLAFEDASTQTLDDDIDPPMVAASSEAAMNADPAGGLQPRWHKVSTTAQTLVVATVASMDIAADSATWEASQGF